MKLKYVDIDRAVKILCEDDKKYNCALLRAYIDDIKKVLKYLKKKN